MSELSSIEHRVMAEIAGYHLVHDTSETHAYTIVNRENKLIAKGPSPNDAWRGFLTLAWFPETNRANLIQLIDGVMRQHGKDKAASAEWLGSQFLNTPTLNLSDLNSGAVIVHALRWTNTEILRVIRQLDCVQKRVKELTEELQKQRAASTE